MISRLETVILYGDATYGRDVYEPLVHATDAYWFSYLVVPQGDHRHVPNAEITNRLALYRVRSFVAQ